MSLEDLAGADGAAEPSIRDSLADAFAAAEASDVGAGESGAAPAPAPAARAAPATQQPATPQAQQPAAGAPQRDGNGRFAKPGEPAQTPKIDPQAPRAASEPDQGQTIGPPPSWSAAAKAEFTKLPPLIQQEVLKREKDMETGKAQWQQGAERLNRLDQVIGPRRERLALTGLDDVQAINVLFTAQDYLERDPIGALLYLGKQSGVHWPSFVQRLQGAPAPQGGPGQPGQLPPGAQVPPNVAPIMRHLQTLTQRLDQRDQAEQRSAASGMQSQIDEFSHDPANVYFENVRGDMGDLIRSGRAKSLKDAYDMACWARPDIRPLMQQAADTQRQAGQRAQATQKVEQARRASGSIVGSPTPGAGAAAGASASIRDALAQAWDEAAA